MSSDCIFLSSSLSAFQMDEKYLKPIFGGKKRGEQERRPVALSPSALEQEVPSSARSGKREPFLKRRGGNEEESEGLLGFEMKSTGKPSGNGGRWRREEEGPDK